MKILVFVKEVPDVAVPLGFDSRTGRIRPDWNVSAMDPGDRSALDLALRIRNGGDAHVTLVHLGPREGERWLRLGLSAGCDRACRFWDEGLEEIQTPAKALILARLARITGFDLILAGNRSQDTGNGQLARLVSCHLGVPCIGSALSIEKDGEERAVVTRRLSGGFQERLGSPFPFVAGVEAFETTARTSTLPQLLDAFQTDIECFDLARVGIPRQQIGTLDAKLVLEPLKAPRSRTKFTPAPDSSLPAFDRISKLIEGTVKRRETKVVAGDDEGVGEELFQTLLSEGWLDHLRKNLQ